jgi:hypothetical protein
MNDLGEAEHLCTNCERDQRDQLEARAKRQELWEQARSMINRQEWPDDGRPCPRDVLNLAVFLAGFVEAD